MRSTKSARRNATAQRHHSAPPPHRSRTAAVVEAIKLNVSTRSTLERETCSSDGCCEVASQEAAELDASPSACVSRDRSVFTVSGGSGGCRPRRASLIYIMPVTPPVERPTRLRPVVQAAADGGAPIKHDPTKKSENFYKSLGAEIMELQRQWTTRSQIRPAERFDN